MRCKRTYKGSKVQAGSSWLSVDWTSTASIWEEAATTPHSTQPRSLKQTQIKRATFSKSATGESSNKQATHMIRGIKESLEFDPTKSGTIGPVPINICKCQGPSSVKLMNQAPAAGLLPPVKLQ